MAPLSHYSPLEILDPWDPTAVLQTQFHLYSAACNCGGIAGFSEVLPAWSVPVRLERTVSRRVVTPAQQTQGSLLLAGEVLIFGALQDQFIIAGEKENDCSDLIIRQPTETLLHQKANALCEMVLVRVCE